MKETISAFVLAVLVSGHSPCMGESPIAPGAKVKKLAGEFSFTEGPAADAEGNVFFTDQPSDRILRWSVAGELSTFKQPSGRSNGLYFDRRGNLLACADEENQLWRISPSGDVEVLIRKYDDKLLNGPNDLWVRPDGGIYFTDPYYKRPYWTRGEMEQDGQHVYFYSTTRFLLRVTDDLVQPNGIVGTPDGSRLYVADIGDNKTYMYRILGNGRLVARELFCNLGSDGMTIDQEGNLYLTGKGVTVFDSAGEQIEHIEIEEPWTANVCFGGRDHKTLFITASQSLYSLEMRVRGAGR